jgi:hypothetical protein
MLCQKRMNVQGCDTVEAYAQVQRVTHSTAPNQIVLNFTNPANGHAINVYMTIAEANNLVERLGNAVRAA